MILDTLPNRNRCAGEAATFSSTSALPNASAHNSSSARMTAMENAATGVAAITSLTIIRAASIRLRESARAWSVATSAVAPNSNDRRDRSM
jgi:hypothetical protein